MAAPGIPNGNLATFTVKAGGNVIPEAFSVFSILIDNSINGIPTARIIILDGEQDSGTFPASSSSTFVPGTEVTIEAGYDNQETVVFKGIITKQTIRIDASVGSTLEVECRDEAVKMIVGRKCLTFSHQKDSDVISSIIGMYKLPANVTATTTVWPEQVQYYVTDWDFICSLAEANGLIIKVLNGSVSVFRPDADTTPVLTVGYGTGLIEFLADLNAVTQLGNVTASSWDYTVQAVSSEAASSDIAGPGNLSTKTLSQVVGLPEYQLQSTAPIETADLTTWAKARIIKSEYAKIRGTAKFQGTGIVEPGNYITLQGLGDRFNGDHIVSGIVHTMSDGNWLTEVSIGLPVTGHTQERSVTAAPASGLLPGARGLFNGIVKAISEDPDSQFRILVDIPMFDPNGAGIWARLSNFYSGKNAGAFFLPEIGDEVVLGFLNEDPRYPIILGSMYSSVNPPGNRFIQDQKNSLKGIVSRSGISIEFDDENKILTIETPSKNTVSLDDKDMSISVRDQNNNSIVLSSDGIIMNSNKNITISAGETLTLNGVNAIAIQSSGGDVNTSALNIKNQAQMHFTGQGNVSSNLDGGTETTIKGAIVLIN